MATGIIMYITILLSLFCTDLSETWSVTLMDVRRLKVFENENLTRIFGHMRKAATGAWRNYST